MVQRIRYGAGGVPYYEQTTDISYGRSSENSNEWQFFDNPTPGTFNLQSNILGDVNFDGVINVVDLVSIVNMILGLNDVIGSADFNEDGVVNVLDIVQVVNHILSGGAQYMPKFMAEDINPASEYYGQMIGPDTFNGDISCYYFGKQG